MVKKALVYCMIVVYSSGIIAHNNQEIKNNAQGVEMVSPEKKTLYYVTGNPSKVTLFAQFIPADAGICLEQVKMDLYEEQTEDQEYIALAKARQAWEIVKKPLIVDEIGVYFHKYKNFPGAFTKHVFKGIGFDGVCKLMDDGDVISKLLIVVLMYGPDSYKIFTVRDTGTFKKPGLLPYDYNAPFDVVFVPEGSDKSYVEIAQQNPKLYNEKYVRARGMREIIEFVSQHKIL